jgi:hypothetical protein
MSRRTSKSAARKADAKPPRPDRPATDGSADPQRGDARSNKWLLAVAVLMQSVWIGLLAVMALSGR